MDPTLDPSLISAVKDFEGFTPKASWDYQQYSNGYGTKAQSPNESIDQPTAESRLTDELSNAQGQVDSLGVQNMPPGVRNALTSLTYNSGPGWMNSGLGDAVKAGDWDKAQSIFLTYNKAGGQVNPGLTARRQTEASWFNQPSATVTASAAPGAGAAGASPSSAAPSPALSSSPAPGMLSGMLGGQQTENDPNMALLAQRAQQLMQQQQQDVPPLALPMLRSPTAMRLRLAALGR